MAIASMQKVMIVAHRSQASELVEALQVAGIVQILDAERAMVSKEWPELMVEARRHRDIEESIDRLSKALGFLKAYGPKDQTSIFAPHIEVQADFYRQVIGDREPLAFLKEVESVYVRLEKLLGEFESRQSLLHRLRPWQSLDMRLEELRTLSTSRTYLGTIPEQHLETATEKMAELGAMLQEVSSYNRHHTVVVVCFNDVALDVQKALRSVDFEDSGFEHLKGTVSENISRLEAELNQVQQEQEQMKKKASELAKSHLLRLRILLDFYQNYHSRMATESSVPATDHAVFFEGWVRQKDYPRLEKVLGRFSAVSASIIQPNAEEPIPIEIENAPAVRPFETITRLYGVPGVGDVDPTFFLAPFFALFFGLCLTDAGYGLVLIAALWWVLKKMQGDKKAIWMMIVCSVMTVIAGALTGGWFADAVQTVLPEGPTAERLNTGRESIMLFDPLGQPLVFIGLSLGLGYFQILFGLCIAFVNNLLRKDYATAIFNQLTWLIYLNCLLLFIMSKAGMVPSALAKAVGIMAIVQAVLIFWFTERKGGLGARIGGGVFALFSTVFYLGDVLSYVRLMALGMVTAGLGMAINILTTLVMDIPYVGFILGLILFVGGHMVNLALSVLSSFVHSLRLQFVEFFPKFFTGGGSQFAPLRNEYQHVRVVESEAAGDVSGNKGF
jgi:V/A-type H+-transporting ATPase subunit I